MNEKRRRGWTKHLDFIIVDIICIEVAYWIAYLARDPDIIMYRGLSLYVLLDIILLAIDIVYVVIWPVYKNILKRGAPREVLSVIFHNMVIWLIAIAYLYLTQQAFFFSRSMMTLAIILCVAFMIAARLSWKAMIRRIMQRGKYQANILLISTAEYSALMIKQFRERMYNGFNLQGLAILDQDMVGEQIELVPVVCNKKTVVDYVKEQAVDEVMICVPGNTRGNRRMINRLLDMGVVVHLALDYVTDDFPNAETEKIGGCTFLTTSISSTGSFRMMIKRLIDIIASLIGLAVTGVVFLFVAPMIYRASPGPIFFKQERVGKNGRRFTLYKFRSMYMDAEERKKDLMEQNEMEGQMFKVENDPRIIGSEKGPGKGIGNMIRRTSIDELPQFINILKGDMSLVGTRPPTVDEFENYEYHHKIRLSMKPGLTGMWQVSGRSKITDFEEIVQLDAYYIEHWSLALDFKIMWMTVGVVLRREGAE
ncbi:MAG: sugar transferase [Lachnospiraceae bacterium]|nr:sugar transferase [Lachnospiraceae bacterium]